MECVPFSIRNVFPSLILDSRCALLQNHSRSAPPKYFADNIVAPYFGEGGHACEGCYWGTSHSPFEVMFVHHFISQRFERGDTAVYSDMAREIQRLAKARSDAAENAAGSLWHGDRKANNVSLWLQQSVHGFCGTTEEGDPFDCTAGASGSFGMPEVDARSWKAASARCLQQCDRCMRCNYITVSVHHRDCSWFHTCDLSAVSGSASHDMFARQFRSGGVSLAVVHMNQTRRRLT